MSTKRRGAAAAPPDVRLRGQKRRKVSVSGRTLVLHSPRPPRGTNLGLEGLLDSYRLKDAAAFLRYCPAPFSVANGALRQARMVTRKLTSMGGFELRR
jgi:hypothetical protein